MCYIASPCYAIVRIPRWERSIGRGHAQSHFHRCWGAWSLQFCDLCELTRFNVCYQITSRMRHQNQPAQYTFFLLPRRHVSRAAAATHFFLRSGVGFDFVRGAVAHKVADVGATCPVTGRTHGSLTARSCSSVGCGFSRRHMCCPVSLGNVFLRSGVESECHTFSQFQNNLLHF